MIRFRMAKINLEQFAILAPQAPEDGISYFVNLGFNGAPNDNRIACTFSVEFMHHDQKLIKLAISCEFDIHPDDWNSYIDNNILTVTKENLCFLANQTVGTARGIMFCKTEGSQFWNFIIPPIDLTKIIDKDLAINLSEQSR